VGANVLEGSWAGALLEADPGVAFATGAATVGVTGGGAGTTAPEGSEADEAMPPASTGDLRSATISYFNGWPCGAFVSRKLLPGDVPTGA